MSLPVCLHGPSRCCCCAGIYTPSTINVSSLQDYEAAMSSVLRAQMQLLNTANWGNNASGSAAFDAGLSQNLTGVTCQLLCAALRLPLRLLLRLRAVGRVCILALRSQTPDPACL